MLTLEPRSWDISVCSKRLGLFIGESTSTYCAIASFTPSSSTLPVFNDLLPLTELAYTMKVDNKTDVYSFGVVTLEVIMGRHPGELISCLSPSASSSSSISTVDCVLLNDVMDQRPSPPVNQVVEEVALAVKLAFACLHVKPQSRPTMQQIARTLSTQWPPLSRPFSMIVLGELLGHGLGGETS